MKVKDIKLPRAIIYSLLFLSFFASCSEDITDDSGNPSPEKSEGVICNVDPFDFEDSAYSRSSLSVSSSGMTFAWDDKEKITIFSDTENSGDFTLQRQSGNTAVFDGGGFDLKEGKLYYAFSKSTKAYGDNGYHNAPESFKSDALTNIICTYEGQRQLADYDPSHLGMYDYQAATATAYATNSARFKFKHLGLTLMMVINDLPANIRFKQLTMYDASEDLFRGFDRTINLSKGVSDSDYSPAWNSSTPNEDAQRFTVDLGAEDGSGIKVEEAYKQLIVFAEIPPFDFTNKTIAFRLTPAEGQTIGDKPVKPYFCLYNGKPLLAGKAYQMVMNAQECTQYTINLKIMHEWIKGNTVNQSRANNAGDPGTTTEDVLPTHLYAFFVNDGALVQTAKMEDIPANCWETVDHISTLKGVGWTIVKEGPESTSPKLTLDNQYTNDPKVYIVATTAAMNFSLAYGTPESDIQALAYNYTNQEQMLGIYSTPYCEGSAFTGALGDDVKDVRLYHVASKVDLNWESEAAALTGNVSVNNFPTTGLKIFAPTKCGGTGTATESVSLNEGNSHYGRTVFYLPQPANATYNVTLGGTTQDITFTPDATYTSWFRGLITKQ